jgi:Nicotinic acid mononucleotide adenylyltransferase
LKRLLIHKNHMGNAQSSIFGSFNPVHVGHISIAKYVLDNTNVDCLCFVLSPHNPFKNGDILTDANERLNALEGVIDDINNYRCNKK